MTTATLPRLTFSPSFPRQLLTYLRIVIEGVLEAREIAGRYDRLARMSNAELARLGLTRQDIPGAAVNGVAGL